MDISVPTLIQYCLGSSTTSANTLSICARNGALPYSRCTEVCINFSDRPYLKNRKNGDWEPFEDLREWWALSEKQSDRFVKAYETDLISLDDVKRELHRQTLLLYDDLSTKLTKLPLSMDGEWSAAKKRVLDTMTECCSDYFDSYQV